MTEKYTLVSQGKVERTAASFRMYTCREVFELFADAGFVDVAASGAVRGGSCFTSSV